jgi:hypothetical protein
MKNKSILALSILVLGACGGNDLSGDINIAYSGTLSGSNCWLMTPMAETVNYRVHIESLNQGATVTLVDASNITWRGTMTSASSFRLTDPTPGADSRFNIVGSSVSSNSAEIAATTSCVSFRCCTTLNGNVTA